PRSARACSSEIRGRRRSALRSRRSRLVAAPEALTASIWSLTAVVTPVSRAIAAFNRLTVLKSSPLAGKFTARTFAPGRDAVLEAVLDGVARVRAVRGDGVGQPTGLDPVVDDEQALVGPSPVGLAVEVRGRLVGEAGLARDGERVEQPAVRALVLLEHHD